MDDGLRMVPTFPESPGHDITPEEMGRHFRSRTTRQRQRDNAILNLEDCTQEGIRFTPIYLQHSRGHLMEEPLDLGPNPAHEIVPEAEDSRRVQPICIEDLPKYYDERERLKTFSQWKQTYSVTPSELARNGFIFTGLKDNVACVFCRKTVFAWEEGDNVEAEHRRLYPACPFVRGQCHGVNKPISHTIADLESQFGIVMRTTEQALFPVYADLQTRLGTYVNWPKAHLLSALALAQCGLFYTGRHDCVRCFDCGVAFSKWRAGEDPPTLHATKNPNCAFIAARWGRAFVQQVNS